MESLAAGITSLSLRERVHGDDRAEDLLADHLHVRVWCPPGRSAR